MNTNGPERLTVRTMLGTRQVPLALRCLDSLQREARHPLAFVLHDDGSLTPDDRARLAERIVHCVIVDRREAGEQVAERLRRHPRCARFRQENILGLKLFDAPLLSQDRTRFCDTDILFTRPVRCAGYFLDESPHPFVAMRDYRDSYAVSFERWPLLRRHGIRLPSRFNSGMFSFGPAVYDLDYMEWLLDLDARTGLFDSMPFWAEQTIYAALAARAGCGYIDPPQCGVAHRANFRRVRRAAIIHLAGPTKALMPQVEAEIHARTGDPLPPLDLEIVPAADCTVLGRLASAVKAKTIYRDTPFFARS